MKRPKPRRADESLEEWLEDWSRRVQLSRREFVKRTGKAAALGALIAGVPEALAACGPSQGQPEITKQAETITLAGDQEPDTLNGYIGSMMARTIVLGAAGAPLVRENDKPEFIAVAAESKPTVDNGGAKFVGTGTDRHLEVTFKIKPHNFHDGQPVTAEDYRFTWLLNMNKDFKSNARSQWAKLWDMKVVDSKTLVAVFMSESQALLAAQGQHPVLKDASEFAQFKDWKGKGAVVDPLYFTFGDLTAPVLPKHILGSIEPAKLEKDPFNRKPIYNGPYKVKEWVAGQQITLEANPDYFLGAPKIKNMVFKFVKDASVMIAGLKAGEIDVATQIGLDLDNKPELDPLKDRYTITLIPGTKWEHIDFNLDDPILNDPHVRRAIAYGVNRKQIIDNLLFGQSQIANAFIPDWHPYYEPNKDKVVKYNYDTAKAEKELQDAGYTKGADGIYAKAGKPLKLKFQTTPATLRKQTAQLIQSDLKKVGIQVDLDFVAAKTFFGQNPPGPLHGRNFQLGMYTWLASFDPNASNLYISSEIPTQANSWGGSNFPGYRGADDLLQKADFNADTVVNEKERIKAYGDVLKQWTTDLPVFPLFLRVSPMVARKELKNWRPTKTSAPETWNSYQWELPAKG